MNDEILKAVDNNYLLEIKNKKLGHLNQTPKQMLTQLKNRGDQLDYADTKKLLADCDFKWDPNKVPKVYFNRMVKALNDLTQALKGKSNPEGLNTDFRKGYPHSKNNGKSETIVRLCCDARGSNNNILIKQHDTIVISNAGYCNKKRACS
jgi:hypothetical protein